MASLAALHVLSQSLLFTPLIICNQSVLLEHTHKIGELEHICLLPLIIYLVEVLNRLLLAILSFSLLMHFIRENGLQLEMIFPSILGMLWVSHHQGMNR